MFNSLMADISSSIVSFFTQLTAAIGFGGYLAIAIGIEIFFILLFLLKSAFSYEARLKRSLDKFNNWLFIQKKIDTNNIKDFNNLVKKGPKRFIYFWQQFILYREKGPTYYMSEENLIDKPLKTSSWNSNIKNLTLVTAVWAVISMLFGFASQAGSAFSLNLFAIAFVSPALVLLLGTIAILVLKAKRVLNLDDIFHNYHIFARFITNACVDLPGFIDYDLLFSQKEISRGNPQLREFYEARARKAKEEFEKAKQNEIEYVEYNFEKAGIDGSLVLERAMKESESYLNKKQNILTKIADIDMQTEALKRNYENTQKELQKKIQATKENIAKYLQQQEATTSRMEVSFIRKQQDQERAKQEQLQQEFDQEETRYAIASDELKKSLEELQSQLEESKEQVQNAMMAEYQSFYEKLSKISIEKAESKVKNEITQLRDKATESDKQLTIVQTQIKRLQDENETLRAALIKCGAEKSLNAPVGKYDEKGNYVYEDGSYHDTEGRFHDKNGNVYDINGNLIDYQNMEVGDNSSEEDLSKENSDDDKIDEIIKQQFGNKDLIIESQAVGQAEKKKRGRPRKVVVESVEPKVPKKRGRPRKDSINNAVQSEIDLNKEKGSKKRSPYKKSAGRKPKNKTAKEKKSPTLAQINKLISEEEDKLAKMKSFINSEIEDAMSNKDSEEIDKEKDAIIKAVEDLKEKAENIKKTEKSEDEMAKINSRLEELIKEISVLNNKK